MTLLHRICRRSLLYRATAALAPYLVCHKRFRLPPRGSMSWRPGRSPQTRPPTAGTSSCLHHRSLPMACLLHSRVWAIHTYNRSVARMHIQEGTLEQARQHKDYSTDADTVHSCSCARSCQHAGVCPWSNAQRLGSTCAVRDCLVCWQKPGEQVRLHIQGQDARKHCQKDECHSDEQGAADGLAVLRHAAVSDSVHFRADWLDSSLLSCLNSHKFP